MHPLTIHLCCWSITVSLFIDITDHCQRTCQQISRYKGCCPTFYPGNSSLRLGIRYPKPVRKLVIQSPGFDLLVSLDHYHLMACHETVHGAPRFTVHPRTGASSVANEPSRWLPGNPWLWCANKKW